MIEQHQLSARADSWCLCVFTAMTERQAETIANLVIGAAAIGAAIYVLRTPALRRVLWGAARNTLIAGLPAWLLAETRNGWVGSTDKPRQPRDMIGA
jgi:hypothetical protein